MCFIHYMYPQRARGGSYVTVQVCVADSVARQVASEMDQLQASLLRG
jgi:hypothetical protein